jgi:hypothetical protein
VDLALFDGKQVGTRQAIAEQTETADLWLLPKDDQRCILDYPTSPKIRSLVQDFNRIPWSELRQLLSEIFET